MSDNQTQHREPRIGEIQAANFVAAPCGKRGVAHRATATITEIKTPERRALLPQE